MENRKIGGVGKLCLVSIMAMLLPFAVYRFRERPPQAATPDKLWQQVFAHERGRIETELGQRDSKFVKAADTAARWKILEQTMLDAGATPAEATAVLNEARTFLSYDKRGYPLPHWPILVRRGYVVGKPMWVTVCAAQSEDPNAAEIVTGWDYYVRTIDPVNPRDLSGNQAFPRCEGINTPFPVS